MTWCWLARIAEEVDGALASAPLTDAAGTPAGVLAAWPAGRKPVAQAVRADSRVIDPEGAAGWLSIVLIDRGRARSTTGGSCAVTGCSSPRVVARGSGGSASRPSASRRTPTVFRSMRTCVRASDCGRSATSTASGH